MLYDCFTFFNEMDLLEIRLNVLNDHVDKFVLVEMDHTHQGSPKPFWFEENKGRYWQFLDKIIHVKVESHGFPCAWTAENYQRDQIMRGLSDAGPDDLVMIGDLDEVPNPFLIPDACPYGATFLQQMHYYYLNVENVGFSNWTGTRILPFCKLESPQKTRLSTYDSIQNAGWHWSYLGGAERISHKIKSFAHGEYNTPQYTDVESIRRKVESFQDIFDRGDNYQKVPVDGRYPSFLLENQVRYKHLIL